MSVCIAACIHLRTTSSHVGSKIRVVYISLGIMLPAKSLIELAGILYSCGYGALARYMQKGFIRFLRLYKQREYEDAAMWGRRMAECFLLLVLEKNEAAEYGLLGDMIHALPDEVSWLPTRDVEYEDIRAVAAELGIGFSSKTIWDDLKTLQWYGNRAAHARGYVDHGPMGPDDGVFVATVRVVVWFIIFYRKVRCASRL